jgi:branched-chain amino acid transport system substrate-binding protein
MPRSLRPSVLAAGLALVAFAAAPVASAKKPAPAPIAIGVEAPISGPQSSNGVDILRGVQLAVRQANARGGVLGRRVVLVKGDDRGDAKRAKPTARRVIARKPVAVIGPYNSSVGLENLPLYRAARVLPLWLTSSDDTQGAGVTLQPMNSQIAPVEAAYVAQQGAKKVAMLVDDTANGAFTEGMASRLRTRLQANGVAVTWISVEESADVPPGYYTGKVAEALASGPDLVYSSTYYPEGAQIARALQAAGSAPACLMGLANVDPGFVAATGTATAKRCVFSGVPDAGQLPSARAFVRQYRAAFKTQPGVWGVFSYDSANLLFAAIRKTGATGYGKLARALRGVRKAKGQTGPISIAPKTGYRTTLPFLGILRVDDAGKYVVVR